MYKLCPEKILIELHNRLKVFMTHTKIINFILHTYYLAAYFNSIALHSHSNQVHNKERPKIEDKNANDRNITTSQQSTSNLVYRLIFNFIQYKYVWLKTKVQTHLINTYYDIKHSIPKPY